MDFLKYQQKVSKSQKSHLRFRVFMGAFFDFFDFFDFLSVFIPPFRQ